MVTILLFSVGIFPASSAQEDLLYEIPYKLSEEVNSDAEEAAVLVSPDGKTLYFSRIMYEANTGGLKGGQDIWTSATDGKGAWYIAEHNLLSLNNKGDNAVIGVSEDGNSLYLLNKYVGKKTSMGVSVSTRGEGEQWSAPETLNIPGLISNSSYYGFNMDPSGKYLVISMNSRGSLGKEDLYVSKSEGGIWSNPIQLGNVINSPGFEITPFLTADAKTIYFSSNGRGGFGDADIYKSDRLDDTWTNWSEPVNMGDNINSAGFDAYFSITPANRIFFSSNRSGILSDIFESKVLERLVLRDRVEVDESSTAMIVNGEEETIYETNVVPGDVEVVTRDYEGQLVGDSGNSSIEKEDLIAEPLIEVNTIGEELASLAMTDEGGSESQLSELAAAGEEEQTNSDETNSESSGSELEEITALVDELIAEENSGEQSGGGENAAVIEERTSDPLMESFNPGTNESVSAVDSSKERSSEEVAVVEEAQSGMVVNEVLSDSADRFSEVKEEVLAEVKEEEAVINDDPEVLKILIETAEDSSVVVPPEVEGEPTEEATATGEIPVVPEVASLEPETASEEVAIEPPASEEPLVSEVSARKEVSNAGEVFFDLNSSYFSEEEAKKLEVIYDQLSGRPGLKLEVLGYSDNMGEEFYNIWISERRAGRVIQFLVDKGIDSNRLSGKWFGEANQAASCTQCTDAQHQTNRRVELILQ